MNRFSLKFWIELALAALMGLLVSGRCASAQTAMTNGDDVIFSGFFACPTPIGAESTCISGIHYVDLVQGQTYDMRMASTEFTAYLVLEDLQGHQLAADNDDFDALNGRIVFRAPATASYRLIATAHQPMHEGFYTITVREMPALMSVEDVLALGDSMTNDCWLKTYDLPMTAGRRYIIDLQSEEFEAFVKLTNEEGAIIAFADEARPGGMIRLVYESPRDQIVRILCTTREPWTAGLFTLNVCEE